MDRIARLRLLEKLRDLCGKVAVVNKEIASTPVAGLELVRQDLEGKKPHHTVYGQKHKSPTNSNKITPPAGMGICSDSPNVAPFYQAGANADE